MATEALAQSTGQKVRLGGEPRVSFFPAPAVTLEKVVFPMSGDQSLDAEGVVARLRLLPLLIGRLEVADVTLNRPTLVVTGKSLVMGPALVGLVAGPNRPELRLVGGTIAVRNADGLTEELVSGINARLDRSAGGGSLVAKIAFAWRDRTADADLELANAAAFITGEPCGTRLDITSGTSWMRFKGSSSAGPNAKAQGDFSGEASSLRDLLAWVGLPAPTAGGLGRFAFSAKIAADRTGVQLSPVSAELDGNRSEGALSLKLDGERPEIQGTFAADALDLTPYGRFVMTEPSDGAWDRSALNVHPLSRIDIDLRLSAARMRAEDSNFERVATSAVLRSGRLVVALGTAQAWGGNVRASLDLSPAKDGVGTTMRLQADGTGISLERTFGDLLGIRRIEGSGDVQTVLEGSGASYYEIAQSLSGNVALRVSNGAIAGIDIGQVMRRIERRPLSGGGDLRGGRTPFEQLGAKIFIADGIATLQQAHMEGKQVLLSLEGEVAVGSRDIDLQGRAVLLPAGSGTSDRQAAPFDLPFIVQGPWSSPYVMLDPKSLIQRSGAAQPLLDAVRNKGVGEAAVRSVIEQLAKPTALPPAPTKAGN
ncbi:AsmA-like C-terminal region-containing protein [Aquabacter sp. CN5-332]